MLADIYKNKWIWMLLRGALLAGILFHSLVFFAINKFYPLSGANYSVELLEQRISCRVFAETISGGCSGIFIFGSMLLAFSILRNGSLRDIRRWFGYSALTVFLMFVCTVPFAMIDPSFRGDYLFPVWGDTLVLIVLFILMSAAYLIKSIWLGK